MSPGINVILELVYRPKYKMVQLSVSNPYPISDMSHHPRNELQVAWNVTSMSNCQPDRTNRPLLAAASPTSPIYDEGDKCSIIHVLLSIAVIFFSNSSGVGTFNKNYYIILVQCFCGNKIPIFSWAAMIFSKYLCFFQSYWTCSWTCFCSKDAAFLIKKNF